MGRLMDRILTTIDPTAAGAPAAVRAELAHIASHCHWTSGVWPELGMKWNDIQNLSRHAQQLSSFLIRTYAQSRTPRP
jgi:hypothetical protein